MKAALLQTDIFWLDVQANLAAIEEKVWELSSTPADLIVLPEMFNTGYCMDTSRTAEPMNGLTCKWMLHIARLTGAHVAGSLAVREGQQVYNRLIVAKPTGGYAHYDKMHLFGLSGESVVYTKGHEPLILPIADMNVFFGICYDLRFPEHARNTYNSDGCSYDAAVWVASWPASRITHWDTLLAARAIENQSFSLGVNRLGTDGLDVYYNGHSCIYSFDGQPLAPLTSVQGWVFATLSSEQLGQYRAKFPFLQDA